MTKPICKIEDCGNTVHVKPYCRRHHNRYKKYGCPLKGGTFFGEPMRFLKAAITSETDECIVWPYAKRGQYGEIYIDGRKRCAYRVLMEMIDPRDCYKGLEAAHAPIICHNGYCINPRHLRWATPKENSADMALDGTQRRGEEVNGSKLTRFDVLTIRDDNRKHSVIADEYGVVRQTIGDIKNRRRWAWLD